MTQFVAPATVDRVVLQSRHRVIRRPLQASDSDVIAALRAELHAVFERLDAYLADQRPATPPPPREPAAVDQADPFEGLPALISVGKAAQILGLSRATAYRLADNDELPVQRMGGRVYVVTARLRATFGGAA
ncbi:hypothetical protein FrEUN1fDRAFT_6607 [Parafrankia sp. EUN1f]|nr:hypothetical protein FrEUN1fDRAFT_6607 [Parafrankia sp. EUN1f]